MASLPGKIRIGTRASLLARWQADHLAECLGRLGVATEIILIETAGDLSPDALPEAMSDKGIFIKELEQALLEDRIDLAVHSLKDLPTNLLPGLVLAAVLRRESPLDAWISPSGLTLETIAAGMRVATGSPRRAAQILWLRPDLRIVPIRGNVPTRLEKIKRGDAEATLLAVAGLRRLGLEREITQILSPEQMTPAMGQGAIGIESREGRFAELWTAIEDPPTRQAVDAERLFLSRVGGGCRTPVGILVQPTGDASWRLSAMLAVADGSQLMRARITIPPAEELGPAADQAARGMIGQASPEIRALFAQ